MGLVTEHLLKLIAKQVADNGLVVWYDPEGHYRAVVQAWPLADVEIACYEDSFFALRYRIRHLLKGLEPPRLVVYVPLAQTATHHALVELEHYGVVMQPGQHPATRNTRLSLLARHALREPLGESVAMEYERQAAAGKLNLAELDRLAEKSTAITQGVVRVIFQSDNATDIALEFLRQPELDARISEKDALPELAVMLQAALGVAWPAHETPAHVRQRLARYVLLTDFLAALAGPPPDALAAVATACQPAQREAVLALVHAWRQRSDWRNSYAVCAEQAEKDLGLAQISFRRDQLASAETFPALEQTLCHLVVEELITAPRADLVELARTRRSRFWAEQAAGIQAQWALVATAGQVLLEAARTDARRKSWAGGDATQLFLEYTADEQPLCALDTAHRHLERLYHNFDFLDDAHHDGLQKLVVQARQAYMAAAAALAEAFLRRWHAQKFALAGVRRQSDIFDDIVKPLLRQEKVAYLWVDALRYEMARDLVHGLRDEFAVTLETACAAVPTITEIGMAALLPRAAAPVSVVAAGPSKLAWQIGDKVIKDRKDRINFLRAHAGVSVFEAKLEDLLPSPKNKIKEGIRAAELVLITSQEIDALCEGDNVPLARRTMDGMLEELRRGVRVLANLGVATIVLTADHGYLFGDELDDAMKIERPGGIQADLHRRVWVGQGGNADPAVMRAELAAFGLGGGLEIAAPWNFSCFKVPGGAKAYFHGGLSLPELAIPVATITSRQRKPAHAGGNILWRLTLGSKKISTRFCSVQIAGQSADLFGFAPPKVRVEVRARHKLLSETVSASYGFDEATGDVQLRADESAENALGPNTITLAIIEETDHKTVTLHLLNAVTGAELARLNDIPLAIAF